MKKLGLIQSRGLGDIIIALPIARHYYEKGYEVHWPICAEFIPHFVNHVTWVKWHAVETDPQGMFYYHRPMEILQVENCEEVICLYQNLNVVPSLSQVPWFQIQKFDEFKYTRANVPFIKKWTLGGILDRNAEAEHKLFARLVPKDQPYYVTHLSGSNYTAQVDLSHMPAEWHRIDIDPMATDSVFNWLRVLSRAEAVICVDSVFSNLVDQMLLNVDKYFIPRSHIHLTPVLGSDWVILDPPPDSLAARPLFKSN